MKTEPLHELNRECVALATYLTGYPPANYLAQKYREAHEKSGRFTARGHFDAYLLRWAARGPRRAALADAYACWFARRSAVRRKLILLMAIMESGPPRLGFSDRAVTGFPLRLAARGAGFALRLLTGLVALAPVHLVLGLYEGRAGGSR